MIIGALAGMMFCRRGERTTSQPGTFSERGEHPKKQNASPFGPEDGFQSNWSGKTKRNYRCWSGWDFWQCVAGLKRNFGCLL